MCYLKFYIFFGVSGLFVLFLFLLMIVLRRRYKYWTDKKVACDPPVLFIGCMKDVVLFRKSFREVLQGVYDRYPLKRYVGIFRGVEPLLLLRDPDLIKTVLIKDFHYFPNRDGAKNFDTDVLSVNLVGLEGDDWRYMRQKLTPAFTANKIKRMCELVCDCGGKFQEYLDAKTGDVEMKDLMEKYAIEVIGNCAFGLETKAMVCENTAFDIVGRQIFEPRPYRNFIREFTPALFRLFKMDINRNEVGDFFVGLVKELLKERKRTTKRRNDFIDLMIDIRECKENEKDPNYMELTDKLITAQAFVFFSAGLETSAASVSLALHELAFNTDIQDKVVEEIDTVLNKHDGRLTYEALKEMKYVDMVLNESMRKYPPVGYLRRKCIQKYTLPNTDVVIDRGVTLIVPVQGLHHDPQHYPEPHKFIPERFSTEEKPSRPSCVYLPFGEGPRNCIALRFARIQGMVGLVSLLQKFKVEPSVKTKRELKFEPRNFILTAVGGVWLKLSRRSRGSN